jgi:hypothetical protein
VPIVLGGVRMMYVAYGSYLKCADARIASAAIGSSTRFCARPSVTMSDGTGVGSVQTPFNWCVWFLMNSAPGRPAQLVVPARTFRQYCVCTPAHGLPPTLSKKEFR